MFNINVKYKNEFMYIQETLEVRSSYVPEKVGVNKKKRKNDTAVINNGIRRVYGNRTQLTKGR
jgi:hypothetical protein